MRPLSYFIFVCLLIWTTPSLAYVEFNGFYTSEGLTVTGGNSADSRTYFEGALGFSIDKASRYLVGWGYASFSNSDQAPGGGTTTYTSTQMGPRFVYNIDKQKHWSAAFAYYIVSNANYTKANSSAEEWKGTALKFDLGYNFEISTQFMFGLRMNYSSASYTDKYVGSSWTETSMTKTSIYPSVYSIYYF